MAFKKTSGNYLYSSQPPRSSLCQGKSRVSMHHNQEKDRVHPSSFCTAHRRRAREKACPGLQWMKNEYLWINIATPSYFPCIICQYFKVIQLGFKTPNSREFCWFRKKSKRFLEKYVQASFLCCGDQTDGLFVEQIQLIRNKELA